LGQREDLPGEHFLWLIGSLCQISRLPFDPELILQRFPRAAFGSPAPRSPATARSPSTAATSAIFPPTSCASTSASRPRKRIFSAAPSTYENLVAANPNATFDQVARKAMQMRVIDEGQT